MELVLGGTAAVCAAFWTNPLEVVKIRMQLQGELQAKGNYAVHYRNVFHAAYTIATKEGATAIQKGLVPALWYQFVMNGIRLGLFHKGESRGFTKNGATGKVDPVRSVMVASVCGATGGVIGSPFCLIKTQLQSKSNASAIAVGHQHSASGMCAAVKSIFQSHGVLGLWRGMSTTLVRVVVVSAVQLPTFAKAREYVTSKGWFPEGSVINAFIASLLSGVLVSIAMAPLDLVSTRFYNQGVDAKGKGLMYSTVRNCAWKIFRAEGVLGFFKGWTAIYFRLGPHTLLSLVFWDILKSKYNKKH
ncbi:solute carrier family 25 member 35 [Folsomia candida]|uniref:solute carrier family 25 member 35 n=1 Tax=Folsomia candida TaxID=158441 RepID=UPI000B8FA09E|nr:solute carrier family 25 member 35 [Folsomia candida]